MESYPLCLVAARLQEVHAVCNIFIYGHPYSAVLSYARGESKNGNSSALTDTRIRRSNVLGVLHEIPYDRDLFQTRIPASTGENNAVQK